MQKSSRKQRDKYNHYAIVLHFLLVFQLHLKFQMDQNVQLDLYLKLCTLLNNQNVGLLEQYIHYKRDQITIFLLRIKLIRDLVVIIEWHEQLVQIHDRE